MFAFSFTGGVDGAEPCNVSCSTRRIVLNCWLDCILSIINSPLTLVLFQAHMSCVGYITKYLPAMAMCYSWLLILNSFFPSMALTGWFDKRVLRCKYVPIIYSQRPNSDLKLLCCFCERENRDLLLPSWAVLFCLQSYSVGQSFTILSCFLTF